MNHSRLFGGGVLLILAVCSFSMTESRDRINEASHLQMLADYMTGFFSSARQAESDPDYHPITLHMTRIWKERSDGFWLYVEQALQDKPPYRQRVYHVTSLASTTFQSAVFELENPLQYAGSWNSPDVFDSIGPENLIPRPGCVITLAFEQGVFSGSTTGKECLSDHRDAVYVTSEVTITSRQLVSWDRGFDANDQLVWGAEKGGYVFDKIESGGDGY